jgi:RNA polymerase sigma-70 factor (ECF subfamily)
VIFRKRRQYICRSDGRDFVNERYENEELKAEIVALIPVLRSFARRFYRNNQDVEDLVQETLLRSLSNLEKFEKGTRLKSWMFTVMRNAFCTRFKKAKRETPMSVEILSQRTSIDAPQEWRAQIHGLALAFDHLSTKQRSALVSVVLNGSSYEAAARDQGCAIGTIKSRINRAREQMAAELDIEFRPHNDLR